MLRSRLGRCCLYSALGVRPGASQGELREAYLRLAKQHHPDTSGSGTCTTRFQRVQLAWETLRDPQRRMAYDATGVPSGPAFRTPAPKPTRNASTSTNHWYEDLRSAQKARMRQEMREPD
ncbi:unnamed protein product, partial [Effrenium voratum]